MGNTITRMTRDAIWHKSSSVVYAVKIDDHFDLQYTESWKVSMLIHISGALPNRKFLWWQGCFKANGLYSITSPFKHEDVNVHVTQKGWSLFSMECRLRPSPNARKQQDGWPKKIVKIVKTSFAFCWMEIFAQRNQDFCTAEGNKILAGGGICSLCCIISSKSHSLYNLCKMQYLIITCMWSKCMTW